MQSQLRVVAWHQLGCLNQRGLQMFIPLLGDWPTPLLLGRTALRARQPPSSSLPDGLFETHQLRAEEFERCRRVDWRHGLHSQEAPGKRRNKYGTLDLTIGDDLGNIEFLCFSICK